jgi:cell division protein ZapE
LPAIALIKKNCEVMMLDDHKDHRLGRKLQQNKYLTPLNQATEEILTHEFNCYAQQALSDTVLTIQNRNIAYVKMSQRVIWFDFDVICNLPRSQLDFLEIADRFDTIFVSNIPVIAADDTTHVILFIHFVDVMYDRGIRLIISAAVAAEELYVQGPMLNSFQRTLSRLHEMQSADYLARHPRIV